MPLTLRGVAMNAERTVGALTEPKVRRKPAGRPAGLGPVPLAA
jgi:hypothetical protein